MWKKVSLLGLLTVSLMALGGCQATKSATPATSSQRTPTSQAVPTLFFHGYGSSYRAEEHMANAAVKAGVTKTIVRAIVANDGQVQLSGTFKKNDRHPIVEVGFTNNHNSDSETAGRWAKNVVVALQKRDGIKKFNVVGHSMGNMAIVYYLLNNATNSKLPQLQKQVDIAGHFNGILGMDDQANQMKLRTDGQPTKMNANYRQLLKLRRVFPKNVAVLNIYGDLNDGSHSDGRVSNASSKSLRYLVSSRAKSYREQRIVGKNAQHSKLHENPRVDRALTKFLWNK